MIHMTKMQDNKLKPIVLSAVKAIMQAHLKDLKERGLLFRGNIMDVDVSEDLGRLDFKFSNEFSEFVASQIRDGKFVDGLSNKLVIIIDDNGDKNVEQGRQGSS